MEATISGTTRTRADRKRRWLVGGLAAIPAVALAAGLFLQAASIVLAKRSPELAATFGPASGLSLEAEALRRLSEAASETGDLASAARAAQATAREAWRHEPLAVAATAIVALGFDEQERRRAVLQQAQLLNRRHSLIQGMILEDGLARSDYSVTIQAMDRILRTEPAQSVTFFPLLAQALTYPSAQGEMVKIVDGSADWHHKFLEHAVNQPTAIPGLARYRLASDFAVPHVDRLLVSGLSGQRRLELAQRVHGKVAGTDAERTRWAQDFPPFDWYLSDEPGLRAQTDAAGEALELLVRGGNGGVLARRIVPAGTAAGGITLEVTGAPEGRQEGMLIALSCAETGRDVYEAPLRNGTATYGAGAAAGCQFPQIELRGRAFTGERPLRVRLADPRGVIS